MPGFRSDIRAHMCRYVSRLAGTVAERLANVPEVQSASLRKDGTKNDSCDAT